MTDANPSAISHVSIGTNQFERAIALYDKVLAPPGCKRIMEHPGAVAYGKQYPEFWVQTPIDGQPAATGNGSHVGFIAPTKDAVHAFWDAAIKAGATADGPPYYGCFLRDLDGHKIEASFWDEEPAKTLGMG